MAHPLHEAVYVLLVVVVWQVCQAIGAPAGWQEL